MVITIQNPEIVIPRRILAIGDRESQKLSEVGKISVVAVDEGAKVLDVCELSIPRWVMHSSRSM